MNGSRFVFRILFLAGCVLTASQNVLFAGEALPSSSDQKRAHRKGIAIVFASDGTAQQASIDFYRAVYKTVATGSNWDAIPISSLRQTMTVQSDVNRLGGIPVIDRATFRKGLPRRSTKRGKTKIIPGSPNQELQRLLDNLGAPAAIAVDCTRLGRDLLKSCALYYYDRVSARVIASTVKDFTAGANDGTVWAAPMVKNLDDGISAAQREKDHAMIEELVARKEEDDDDDTKGMISLFGRGDKIRMSGWNQTVAGGGIQLGFLRNNIGVVAEAARLAWQGDGVVKSAQRTNYGLNMQFRAKALQSLLWFFEIGGGKEESKFKGPTGDDTFTVSGVYAEVGPAVGLEINEMMSMDLGISWRWFFEQSSNKSGSLSDSSVSPNNIPGLSLRATFLL